MRVCSCGVAEGGKNCQQWVEVVKMMTARRRMWLGVEDNDAV